MAERTKVDGAQFVVYHEPDEWTPDEAEQLPSKRRELGHGEYHVGYELPDGTFVKTGTVHGGRHLKQSNLAADRAAAAPAPTPEV